MPSPSSRAFIKAKAQSEAERQVDNEARSRAANLVTGDGKPFNGHLSRGKYGTAEPVFSLDLLPKVKLILIGDEYGQVEGTKVIAVGAQHLHSTWFHSGDKHCFRVWGVNEEGKVVCAFRAEYATGDTDKPTSVTVVCTDTASDSFDI